MQNCPVTKEWDEADWLDHLIHPSGVFRFSRPAKRVGVQRLSRRSMFNSLRHLSRIKLGWIGGVYKISQKMSVIRIKDFSCQSTKIPFHMSSYLLCFESQNVPSVLLEEAFVHTSWKSWYISNLIWIEGTKTTDKGGFADNLIVSFLALRMICIGLGTESLFNVFCFFM